METATINDYWFRLALVINTSHSRFNDNLASIIIYALYSICESEQILSAEDISKTINDNLGLEFTAKEIYQCIKENSNYFIDQGYKKISLSEEGMRKVHPERNRTISAIFTRYKKTFNIEQSISEVSQLLYTFLYSCLGRNIKDLLSVVQGESTVGIASINVEGFNDEQRKIVNDFVDWNDSEKNQMLYQLISFAVDYCRLTVKKDSNSFNTLLQGKVFYLDANIIFRMMGLNNAQRQDVVLRFIRKCKESKIKICYTSQTRKEVLDSFHYHVQSIQKALQHYHGDGKALNDFCQKMQWTDGLMDAYLEWCGKTGGYGKYGDFEQYLKSEFFRCVSGMALENADAITTTQEEIDDYFVAKNSKTSVETAECDIKNVKYIQKLRRRSATTIGWNTKEYLISADHKLIDWATKRYGAANPIVVLPSVWYSAILKITGRANNDDERSFAEFIKIRYIQRSQEENFKYLIKTICNKTSDGVLQDLLLTEISENNGTVNKLSTAESSEIEEFVDTTYDNILEKAKDDGFIEGQKDGIEEGKKIGYDNGISIGQASGVEIGEKIGRLKQQKDELLKTVTRNTIKKRRRHIGLLILFSVAVFLVLFYIVKTYGFHIIENYNTGIGLLTSFIGTLPIGYLFESLFPIDAETLEKNEMLKVKLELQNIESQIEIYQPINSTKTQQ